jgi:hypothetical protein
MRLPGLTDALVRVDARQIGGIDDGRRALAGAASMGKIVAVAQVFVQIVESEETIEAISGDEAAN